MRYQEEIASEVQTKEVNANDETDKTDERENIFNITDFESKLDQSEISKGGVNSDLQIQSQETIRTLDFGAGLDDKEECVVEIEEADSININPDRFDDVEIFVDKNSFEETERKVHRVHQEAESAIKNQISKLSWPNEALESQEVEIMTEEPESLQKPQEANLLVCSPTFKMVDEETRDKLQEIEVTKEKPTCEEKKNDTYTSNFEKEAKIRELEGINLYSKYIFLFNLSLQY